MQRQHVKVGVIQLLNANITTIGVEIIVEPNIDVVRRGSINWICNKIR
jgi:hypothetical protein